MTPIDEAQIKVQDKYIVTFMFRSGEALQLPYKNNEAVEKVMKDISIIQHDANLVVVHSSEPVPSLINLLDLVCVTASLAQPITE